MSVQTEWQPIKQQLAENGATRAAQIPTVLSQKGRWGRRAECPQAPVWRSRGVPCPQAPSPPPASPPPAHRSHSSLSRGTQPRVREPLCATNHHRLSSFARPTFILGVPMGRGSARHRWPCARPPARLPRRGRPGPGHRACSKRPRLLQDSFPCSCRIHSGRPVEASAPPLTARPYCKELN